MSSLANDLVVPFWLITTIGIAAILWCAHVRIRLISIDAKQAETLAICITLEKMHRAPDAYGFGTGPVRQLDDSIQELIYYFIIYIENQTGSKPLPPLPKGRAESDRSAEVR